MNSIAAKNKLRIRQEVTRGDRKSSNVIKTKINLTETTGKHALYFVFVNEKAVLGQTLVQIVDIEVLPKVATAAAVPTK